MVSAVNAVHAVVATVTGITSALKAVPGALNTTQLPCAIITPTSETRRQHAHALQRIETLVNVRIVHSPVAQGVTTAQQDALYDLTDDVMDAIMADITLNGQIDHVAEVDAAEASIYSLAGTDYLSISISVRVIEKI